MGIGIIIGIVQRLPSMYVLVFLWSGTSCSQWLVLNTFKNILCIQNLKCGAFLEGKPALIMEVVGNCSLVQFLRRKRGYKICKQLEFSLHSVVSLLGSCWFQRKGDLAVLFWQFLSVPVNETPNICWGSAIFIYYERKHSDTAFLYNLPFFYIELNTIFSLFEVV